MALPDSLVACPLLWPALGGLSQHLNFLVSSTKMGCWHSQKQLFSTVNCLVLPIVRRVDSSWAGKPGTHQSAGHLYPGGHRVKATGSDQYPDLGLPCVWQVLALFFLGVVWPCPPGGLQGHWPLASCQLPSMRGSSAPFLKLRLQTQTDLCLRCGTPSASSMALSQALGFSESPVTSDGNHEN